MIEQCVGRRGDLDRLAYELDGRCVLTAACERLSAHTAPCTCGFQVVARKRLPAATWSSIWYLLSSVAVISYTNNWVYIVFAGAGSWLGAYVTLTYLHRAPANPPPPLGPTAS